MDGLAMMIEGAARALMAEYASKLPEGTEYAHSSAESGNRGALTVTAFWRIPALGQWGYITRGPAGTRAARWESEAMPSIPVPL